MKRLAHLSPLFATLIILGLCGYINNPSAGGGGLSSPVGLADGGTGGAMTAANGGIVFSTASGLDVTTVGTAGQILNSNGAAVPTWTAAPSAGLSGVLCSAHVATSSATITKKYGNCTWTSNTPVIPGISSIVVSGFTNAPNVTLTINQNHAGLCVVDTITTTAFNITCFMSDGTNGLDDNILGVELHGT